MMKLADGKLYENHKVNWFHLFLCLFCISWLNGGFTAQFGIVNFVIFFGIFGLWFLMSFYHRAMRLPSSLLWLLVYALMLFLSSAFLDSIFNKYTYGAFYLIVMMCFTIYYKQEQFKQERKVIWFVYLMEITVIALVTAITCIRDPYVARVIAGGMGDNVSSTNGLLVAKFDNVYAFALLVVFLLAIYSKMIYKKICIVILAVLAICLYFVNFATALFITILFIALMFILKKPSKVAIVSVIAVAFILIFRTLIADLMVFLAYNLNLTDFLSGKLLDIAAVLTKQDIAHDNTLVMRLGYSADALKIFSRHPIIGIYGFTSYLDERVLLRDHNVWFDMLAYFGIVRIIPFLGFLGAWYKNNKAIFSKFKASPIAYVFILWIILGFLNPVNKQSIQVFLFVLLPLSDVLFTKDEELENNVNS